MSEETTEPTLEDIAQAMKTTEGKTPSTVLDAFVPSPVIHQGHRLLPLTAGHELLLAQLGHPLATGEKWDAQDILLALYLFTHPSADLFKQVETGTFHDEFFAFLNTLPASTSEGLGEVIIAHWVNGRKTALAMESPHGASKKKAAASDGSSRLSRRLARYLAGRLITFFTRSL